MGLLKEHPLLPSTQYTSMHCIYSKPQRRRLAIETTVVRINTASQSNSYESLGNPAAKNPIVHWRREDTVPRTQQAVKEKVATVNWPSRQENKGWGCACRGANATLI